MEHINIYSADSRSGRIAPMMAYVPVELIAWKNQQGMKWAELIWAGYLYRTQTLVKIQELEESIEKLTKKLSFYAGLAMQNNNTQKIGGV